MFPLADAPARPPPDSLAIVQGERRWSWRELDRRSAAWAARLRERGVRPDDLVAFAFPNGPDFLALVFGVYRAGATPAPLSPKLPLAERDAILALMRPAVFVDGVESDAPLPVATPRPAPIAQSWKACTSGGSTGRPKVIVDGRPAAFPRGMSFIGLPGSGGKALVAGPLYHNAPFSAAVFALWSGAAIVSLDRFDAETCLAIIARERVEWALMVPTMMHRILRLPEAVRRSYDLTRWRMVVHTAAPMAPWLKRAWIDEFGPDHIWEAYGATEGLARTFIGGREWLERPGSVGKAGGGARFRILGPDGEDLPAGVEGEIYAMPPGGPGSSYRYIGAERRATADGWESVGDVGRLDEDGYLYLADRRADLIISGGVNVWPAEVEAALLRHPAIRSCAVVGVADEDLGECVHAIVEADDAALNLSILREFLTPHLTRDKHPRSLEIQNAPVRDDAGKARKVLLKETSK
ncbi:AMP-binding protein [Acidiphilium sp.]|jgi:bile acid-coenzyme A ligase|uniref:AMP-binding protein n=1 Tax=Acidiphilium sp. TaxID=527 RepID=UPI002590B381|nr:AMP-binding protein [Acidiphilium sp.]